MSDHFYMPSWWREAIVIEYLSCRDFTKGERIAKFDFSLVSEEQIIEALKIHKIVSYGQIFQNVDPATFQSRSIMNLLGSVAKPIVNQDAAAIIPNGVVSKNHFPWLINPISVVDPIESFNSHIQVLDEGVLYQWEIARFEGVEGRNYGRWVSDFVDLSDFDTVHDEFQNLMRTKVVAATEEDTYLCRAERYVNKLKAFRLKAFTELLSVHEDLKKKDVTSRGKIVEYKPPALSHFETMKIESGDIYTTCFISPIFYRAAIKHCLKSRKFFEGKSISHPQILDEIYEERAQAIIMGVACLEAVANEVGKHGYADVWSSLEKLTLNEKLKILHCFAIPSVTFDASRHPFQFVSKMVIARNEMIHFKTDYSKCKVIKGTAVSRMETILAGELIEKLPEVLADSIRQIYSIASLPEPDWLKDQPGWKLGSDL